MEYEKYFELLSNGKRDEADRLRMSTIPDKLIKFIWLDGSENDEKKFLSLSRDEIWFSHKKYLNDKYEFKGMLVDEAKILEAGYPPEIIEEFKLLFDIDDYGITCLSSNSIDYLPMWAYYTNNYKGFCVEYEIKKKDCIHEVMYEPERIKVASLIFQFKEAMTKCKKETADYYSTIFLQNLFIKAKSWEHEKEYRIVYPIDNSKGRNVSVSEIGMRTCKIVAGIECTANDIARLNEISNKLGLGDVYKSQLHNEKYTIDIVR